MTQMKDIERGLRSLSRALNGKDGPSKRRTDPDVVQRVHELASDGYNGAAIERVLSADPEYADRTPSLRTIQDIARDVPVSTEWWSVAGASAEEARLVLPVLADRVDQLKGHGLRGTVRLDKELAQWVAKVRAIAPDLPPREAYRLAWRYWASPSPELDQQLALRIAESREQHEAAPDESAASTEG